jgi:hypothetical protein
LKSRQATTTPAGLPCPSQRSKSPDADSTSPPPNSLRPAPIPSLPPRDLPNRSRDPCAHVVGSGHGGHGGPRRALRVHAPGRLAPGRRRPFRRDRLTPPIHFPQRRRAGQRRKCPLRALTSSPRSPTDLTRSGLFRLCAGSRQVGRSEQPHRPPRAGECATLSSFPSAAGMRLLLRLRWWLLWCSPQGRTERRGHL